METRGGFRMLRHEGRHKYVWNVVYWGTERNVHAANSDYFAGAY
ncbi:hypothetical protein CI610_02632 [invertebrate metagenome]|uniref:Uncharacterized protein n=1 Tax=invertebrate metagenome TaxID=1711999 RepID=A0A2H9T5D4_9ZZZZ